MKRRFAALALLIVAVALTAQDRVPKPDFESGYAFPEVQNPPPRTLTLEYFDIGVLSLSLSAAAYFVLKRRSRTAVFALTIFSIAYFGFFREGCICPVGSVQNVAYALFDSAYRIPIYAAAFFALPLLTTLFAGRVFCSSVCPLGAIQELVVLKPLRVPRWLDRPLRFFPYLYLGLAVLFAATGSDFIICRFDPFVSIFRLGGGFNMLVLGGVFLLVGTVVARPYCRYLCPYGALLRILSPLSYRHATITPDSCIRCGLCTDACPVGAIEPPVSRKVDLDSLERSREKKRLGLFLLVVPIVLALGWFAGSGASGYLSMLHPDARLAARVIEEDAGLVEGTTLESETFRASVRTKDELFSAAAAVKQDFDLGSPILGLFIAIALCSAVAATFLRSEGEDYTIRKSACVSCARCFSHCPREHARRSETAGAPSS